MYNNTAHKGMVVALSLTLLIFCCYYTAAEAMELYQTMDDIVYKADVIFLGKVTNMECRYGPNQKMIFTDVSFEVENLIYRNEKTQPIEKDIMLTFAGGEIGGEIVEVSDVPSFEIGATYLIFTRMDGKTYASPVIGGFQGLFKVVTDTATGTPYPLTYGGNCIVGAGNKKIITGPRVNGIFKGRIQQMPGSAPDRFYAVAPEPAKGWERSGARAAVSKAGRELPGKVIPLPELLTAIQDRLNARKEGR